MAIPYNSATVRRFFSNVTARLLSDIDSHSNLHIKTRVGRFAKISTSEVGRFSYVGPRSQLIRCKVGSFSSISWDCLIGIASHPTDLVSTSPIFFEKINGTGVSWIEKDVDLGPPKFTNIGSDVWIGTRSIVMAGITIGDGAIVGAGSIVTRDVLPYSIVVGAPARHIRYRFSEEIVRELVAHPWFDADEEKLRGALEIFSMRSPSLHEIRSLVSIVKKSE